MRAPYSSDFYLQSQKKMESLGLTLSSSPFKLGIVKVFLMPELLESSLGESVDRNAFLEGG